MASELCSPMYRCFPPQPIICFLCKGTDKTGCLFKEVDKANEK